MKRVTLYIAEPQYDQFQQLAAVQGRPYSELVREALSQYLQRQDTRRQPKKAPRPRARTRGRS